jgi:hypothetical protein
MNHIKLNDIDIRYQILYILLKKILTGALKNL